MKVKGIAAGVLTAAMGVGPTWQDSQGCFFLYRKKAEAAPAEPREARPPAGPPPAARRPPSTTSRARSTSRPR